jgi:NAD(P)-dependent dehydrogenase (short-subunit alcohol dehydrogenase family)
VAELSGKVALVTGGTLGIGRAAAVALANEGADVMICGSGQQHLDDALEAMRADGLEVQGFRADVSNADEVKALVAATVERFGGIDITVNSAGIQRYGTALETSEETWDRVMDVNVKAMFLVARYVLPSMIERGGGSIVNVSSVQAFIALEGSLAYVTSKGAINSMTRALALDHAAQGIRVNVVCPGSVDTPLLRDAADLFRGERSNDDLVAEWGRMHPLGRIGQPSEVGDLIAYLAGPRSSFITGASIPVDGGLLTTVGVELAHEERS